MWTKPRTPRKKDVEARARCGKKERHWRKKAFPGQLVPPLTHCWNRLCTVVVRVVAIVLDVLRGSESDCEVHLKREKIRFEVALMWPT